MKNIILHRSWDTIIVICVAVLAWILPANVVLNIRDSSSYIFFNVIITIIFLIDAIYRVSRPNESTIGITGDHNASGRKFSTVWFLVDISAAIPFGILPVTKLLQILPLLKLVRIGQIMQFWLQREIHRAAIIRLIFFTFWLSLISHWIACGWIGIHGIENFPDNLTAYIQSLYWSIQTLSTVGYGDITPTNNIERLYTILCLVTGVGVFGYIIGNIAAIIANMDPAKSHYNEMMERLNAFMRYRFIPENLQQRTRNYFAYLWEKRMGYDESNVMSLLPPSLQTEISLFLKKDIIENVPLFQDASEQFIREIALHMQAVTFLPGDYIMRAGERGSEMYFISHGTVEVISKTGPTPIATLKSGDFFGEMALFLKQPRIASVRALTYCDLYSLDKDTFDKVLVSHPDIADQIETKMKDRMKI